MKKILPVLLVVIIALSFGACKSKQYVDKEVTIPVTDEFGDEVTDKNGTVVTEVVTEGKTTDKDSTTTTASAKKETTDKNQDKKETTTKKSDKTEKTDKETTTKKGSTTTTTTTTTTTATEKSTEKTTAKKETTTEATTKKPEKRDVTIDIFIPSKDLVDAKLYVKYKVEGDKKVQLYKFENPENKKEKLDYTTVKMDGKTVVSCKLEKVLGKVVVKCDIELSTGEIYELSDNKIVIGEYEDKGEIKPYSGIEELDAGEI